MRVKRNFDEKVRRKRIWILEGGGRNNQTEFHFSLFRCKKKEITLKG